jgi:SAM-dependent methyltransferase
MKAEELKFIVKEKYGEIASQSKLINQSSCCGSTGCCGSVDYTIFSDDYSGQAGYNPDADLGLGCGIPTNFAAIKEGDHVLDLGSGAGNDCFVARALVGESGKVTGLDFTDAMIAKATENNMKLGFKNVDIVKGDIEEMPLPDDSFDVIVSN